MKHYDLAILGTGSGNAVINDSMDDMSIAIVEPGAFGGTCLNRGCIPSKMFVHPSTVAYEAKNSDKYDISTSYEGVDWKAMRDRIFGRIDPLAEDGKEYRKKSDNVDVYEAKARFVGEKTIEAAGETFTADQILIAVGSTPYILPIPGIDSLPVDTSDTIMRIDSLPESITIIGGGTVAVEMAHVFHSLGSKVTIVQRSERLLSKEDKDIGEALTEAFIRRGMDLRLGVVPQAISRDDSNNYHLVLDKGVEIVSERVLVVTGRRSNVFDMNAEATGVELDREGKVVVDEYMQSNVKGIWALGDCASRHLDLKHLANAHARAISHNIMNPDDLMKPVIPNQPSATFCQPEICSVGLTEEEAKEQGLDFISHKQPIGNTAYGWALMEEHDFCKIIVDKKTRKLLGAHIIGFQASLLSQPLIMGMTFDLTVDEIAKQQIWPHPSLSEVVEQCLLAV